MYPNLKREMYMKRITHAQIAHATSVRASTITEKINGKHEFKSSEMFTIQKEFFPELTLEYLFKQE